MYIGEPFSQRELQILGGKNGRFRIFEGKKKDVPFFWQIV